MSDKQIGKIQSVTFGMGGYDDAMIGISFTLGSDTESWSVGDFWGHSGKDEKSKIDHERDILRTASLGITMQKIFNILLEAKAETLDDLKGKPVEVEFLNQKLVSWRILKEAI